MRIVTPSAALLLMSGVVADVENGIPMPSTDGFFFSETFENGDVFSSGAWAKSSDSKYSGQPVSVAVEPASKDTTLLLKNANQHYGLGAKFPEALDVTDKDFVVQYEVKLDEGLTCGGAYIKVLESTSDLDVSALANDSPYVVMFGPDACGDTNKVHFIMRHQNPISGEWEEKHATSTPTPKKDTKTHLYTLVVKTDNSYEMYVDMESAAKGSLLEDMEPPVNPAKVIDDPSDHKPEDWVDEQKIQDPDATKPDDWDEDAPKKIPDAAAVKPADWYDDEPDFVPDPSASIPDDWDEEEDGDWEAPQIPNPKCKKAGCGEWKRPEIDNPDYKGKWSAPYIDNPAYIGEWKAKQIDNPHYFVDEKPHNMAKMGAVAVEIWTTNGGIRMDNFVIGDDAAAVLAFGKDTYGPKAAMELLNDATAKKEAAQKARDAKREQGGVMNLAEVYLGEVTDVMMANPLPAVITVVVILFTFIYLCGGSSKPRRTPAAAAPAATEAEDEKEEEEDEADDDKAPPEDQAPKKKRTPKAS